MIVKKKDGMGSYRLESIRVDTCIPILWLNGITRVDIPIGETKGDAVGVASNIHGNMDSSRILSRNDCEILTVPWLENPNI